MTDRRAPAWLAQWEYAHRGKHGAGVPENSLEAARLAIEAGMGIECDIQRSLDDCPMVFHDWDVERLTGGEGSTASFSAQELERMTYVGSEERPASLKQLLDLIGERAPLLIEIKSKQGYDVQRTCAVVADALAGYAGDHAVMSFDPRVARWFRRNSPQTCCGLVMSEEKHGSTPSAWRRRLALWFAKPDFLAYHIAALPSRWVAGLRRGGLPILTWTVNSPEMRARALRETDGLISEGDGLA